MEMKQENKISCRVILFPQPYIGHLTPMLNLGNALHSKGFSITIIQTRFNALNQTEYPNFEFYYIEDPMSKDAAPWSTGSLKTIALLNKTCSGVFRDCLSRILEDASINKEAVACLIADPLWEFVGSIADEFNLPRLGLRTGGLLAVILYDSLSLLREKGYFQEFEQEAVVAEVPPLKVKDLPSEEYHEPIAIMAKETRSYCQGIICNTFKELEGSILDRVRSTLRSIPIFPIGPLHKYAPTNLDSIITPEQTSITWLNTQAPNSVLYVSFGTLAAISKEQFLEVAWGIANSEQPFLWAVRPRLIDGFGTDDALFSDAFLKIVNERSHIVAWAPQKEVLAHPAVGGFWTHCGWNSTIESICEGVPMICLPFFGDQKMNARHLSDVLKIALQLEKGLNREDIEKTIRRLMVEKEGDNMRKRAAALKLKAEQCITEGGSSDESLDRLTSHILSFCEIEKMPVQNQLKQ
ncbi:UDP-glycosyltransferase 76B1-like [Silene latifolia]|uniref:UDP-glycosyltransferase 76B1-like n=1 Tax=Silene latifolia TaxID=37657 RepID=UPI003D7785F1